MEKGDLVWVVPCDGNDCLIGNGNPEKNTMHRATNVDGYSVSIDDKSLCWFKKNFRPVRIGDICEVVAQQGDDSAGFVGHCPVKAKAYIVKINPGESYYPLYVTSPEGNMGCQIGSVRLIEPAEHRDGCIAEPKQEAPEYCCFSCANRGNPATCSAYDKCACETATVESHFESCNPDTPSPCRDKLANCWQPKTGKTVGDVVREKVAENRAKKPEVPAEELKARQHRERDNLWCVEPGCHKMAMAGEDTCYEHAVYIPQMPKQFFCRFCACGQEIYDGAFFCADCRAIDGMIQKASYLKDVDIAPFEIEKKRGFIPLDRPRPLNGFPEHRRL